jgi:hypothetical protein
MEHMTFDEWIGRGYWEYLYSDSPEQEFMRMEGPFCPYNTFNRNPDQVPHGIWFRLLFTHVTKNNYN